MSLITLFTQIIVKICNMTNLFNINEFSIVLFSIFEVHLKLMSYDNIIYFFSHRRATNYFSGCRNSVIIRRKKDS